MEKSDKMRRIRKKLSSEAVKRRQNLSRLTLSLKKNLDNELMSLLFLILIFDEKIAFCNGSLMGERFWGVKIENKLLKCGYVLICAQLE